MSEQGWYDAEGVFHEGPPPQPKKLEPEPPAPTGWYDADGNYHEGLPPALVAKRAGEEAAKLEAASQLAAQAPVTPAPNVSVVVQAAPASAEQAATAATAPKKRGGLVAGVILVWTAFVASLAALAMALLGTFSLASFGLSGIAATENAAIAAQLALVPASQAGYSSWRTTPISEQNATPPEVLAKALSGEAPVEPVKAAIAQVTGDRADSYGVTTQSCQNTPLRDALTAEQARGEAWVAALNSDETLGWGGELKLADLKTYTENLTPVVLLADTAVTAHGYVTGAAFPSQVVLQAGTLVGIDRFGVPRVRCVSGEPLTAAPELDGGSVQFTGQQWQGFDAAKIVSVAPSASALSSLDVRFVGAANVEGGSIAPGWRLCDRGDCPTPGPQAVAPDQDVPPAGTVIPSPPAQCSPLNEATKYQFKFYNLSDKPVVVSYVDPATCQTFPDNNWSAIIRPGQLLQGEVPEGQVIQIGNGADAGVLDSVTISEPMVYGIQ